MSGFAELRPPWPLRLNRAELDWFAHQTDPTLVLRDRCRLGAWESCRNAIDQLYELHRTVHFLKHPQGVFPHLRETQITKALQAFLENSSVRKLERCQSLFDALAGGDGPRLKSVEKIRADDQGTRMDLAVHCRDTQDEPCCLVIEAKLEAPLSPKQLPGYREELRNYKPGNLHLWVIAKTQSNSIAENLRLRKNKEWKFLTWHRLLIRWQASLPEEPGPDAMSLLSEIWKRTDGH